MYRQKGWNVLPLINNEKGMVPSWTSKTGYGWIEWQDKKPTDEEFERLFSFPNITGIALMTGKTSNITVVDYDLYAKDAPKINLESSLMSRTASGGLHCYFQYEDIPEMRTEGIEIKNGTLDVLPPSKAINKMRAIGQYKWEKGDSKNIPKLPDFVKALFKPKQQYVKKGMMELLTSGEGNRHHSLLSAANKMYFKFDQADWPLVEDFLRNNLDKFDPPYEVGHPPKDFENILRDAKQFALKNKRAGVTNPVTPEEIPAPISMKQAAIERNLEREKEKKSPKTGYVELDEAIAGWTPGFVYVLAGDTGVGKTAFACNLAIRCSKNGGKVLYYSIETGNEILDYLASARTKKTYDELTDDDISYDDPNIMLYRQEVLDLTSFISSIEKNKDNFNLAIVDNIGFFEEKSGSQVQGQLEMMRSLSKIAMKSNMAIVIIAHFNKEQPGKKNLVTMDRISGSKAFQNYAKGVLLIKRNKVSEAVDEMKYTDEGLLIVAKSKRGENNAFRILFNNKSAYVKSNMDFPAHSLERNGF